MKNLFLLLSFSLFLGTSSFANVIDVNKTAAPLTQEEMIEGLENITIEDFMSMTPRKYKKITGKRLGFKNAIKLKVAKRKMKKMMKKNPTITEGSGVSKGLYIVLAIIGLGWLGMGINDDWSGNDWIISLVLQLVTCIGGLIYTLVKMKKYY